MPLAIVAAMPQELAALRAALQGVRTETHARREFHHGRLGAQDVVLVLSGIGKVAAATTTTMLLDRYRVDAMLFTGVAGGLHPDVHVGDVVIGEQFLQHDMDASPIFPRWEVPGTGRSRFHADPGWAEALNAAATRVLAKSHPELKAFGIEMPRVRRGLIVSGDRFVSSAAESAALRAALPDALAVEMEGAAVAQVCHDFGRPFAVMRTISDRADDNAHVDFPRFLSEVAAGLAHDVMLEALAHPPGRTTP